MRITALMLAITLGGCVVAHENTMHAMSGVVVDSRSGKPIRGVNIYRTINRSKPRLVATTDTAGRFVITGADHVFVGVVLSEVGDQWNSCTLIFRAQGYKDGQIDCSPGRLVPLHGSKNPVVKLHKASNQSMQPTASPRTASLSDD